MELTTSSISNEIDKSIQEEFSISKAAWEDAKLRKESGQEPEAISNEQIKKNDPILNTYKVLDDAIHGGMGSVWRVHHESWNVDLAMKRPQPRFFAEAGDGRKEEFIRECENWINLGLHPNIVSCYYVREIGGVPTIFSEWMDNGSLKDRIRDGSLYEGTEEEVQKRILDIAIQTARGLKYSHENDLIHQDIKPGNILLTKGWDAKVADFGLAKAQSQLTENEKPVSTGYTIQYCPREQAEGAPAEKWMDVYAWALTVLEMFVGKRLWETGAEAKEHCEEYFSQCRILISGTMCELLGSCLNSPAENFLPFETILKNEYKEKFGYDYPRQEPEAAADSADSLNNMALSFLDLGYTEKAREIFEKADKLDKNNKTVFLNNLLLQWRSGKRSDIGTLRHFNENGILVMSQEEYNLALAQLYCENGDYKKAMKLAEQHEKELDGWKPLLEYLLLEPEIAAFEKTPSTGSKSRKVRVEEDDAKNLHLYNSSLPMRKQKMLLPAYVSNLEFCFNYMISPNEKMLVTVSDNNRAVQIWDTNTGKLIKRDVCRIYGRWSEVKFSTDSKLLIVCSNEMVRVFSTVDKYNQVFQFSFDEVPYSAAFSIKNKLMITGFSGGRICSYSLPEGKKLREYQVGDSDQNVKSVDLTLDGDLAVCCYGRNAICLMELPAGKCIQTFERHQNFEANIHAVRFSEDWTSVLYDETNLSFVRSEYGSAYRIRPHSYRTPMSLVKIKDTVTQTQEGRMLEELLTKAENALRNAKPQEASGFLEKARQLSGTQDVSRICRLNEKLSKFGKVSGIRAVWQEGSFSFGREKKYGVIAVDGRGRIYLEENVNMAWKVRVFEAGKGIKDLVGELRPSTLKDFVLSSDEEKAYIYSYSYVTRSAVIECQISSGHYRSLKCEAEVRGFDLSDNDELIAIMTKDEEVHIYECKTERQLPYIYHCEGLSTIRFCGESLLYIVAKQKKVIWDYVNNRIVCENTGPEYYYFRPAISPDKHFVADLSEKKDCIEICNLKNGVIAAQCETQFPDKIEFVQKGRFLVTQKAKEETALFWDTETGNCIYKFSGGTLPAREFFFSGDGQRVYAVHAENTVTSWYIDYIYSFDN